MSVQRVVSVGAVPAGASGVRDYGTELSRVLRRSNLETEEVWFEIDGRSLRSSLRLTLDLFRMSARLRETDIAVWHYSAFAYAFRGVPLPSVMFGLWVRSRRRVPVLTILHEPRYAWGRRGLRGRVQSLGTAVALPLVVAGSDALLTTTRERQHELSTLTNRLSVVLRPRPVECHPVFATVDPCNARIDVSVRTPRTFSIGVVAYTGDGASPEVVLRGLEQCWDNGMRVTLIGSPGIDDRDSRRWVEVAHQLRLHHAMSFTGIVTRSQISRYLAESDIVIFASELGPSSRRTTVANALAHGTAMIALDGPETWSDLVTSGAVSLIPPDPRRLAEAVEALRASPQMRKRLGDRGRRFYEERMAPEGVARWVNSEVTRLQLR